jgi:hypothetical protein
MAQNKTTLEDTIHKECADFKTFGRCTDCAALALSIQALIASSKPEKKDVFNFTFQSEYDFQHGYNQAIQDWENNMKEKELLP